MNMRAGIVLLIGICLISLIGDVVLLRQLSRVEAGNPGPADVVEHQKVLRPEGPYTRYVNKIHFACSAVLAAPIFLFPSHPGEGETISPANGPLVEVLTNTVDVDF